MIWLTWRQQRLEAMIVGGMALLGTALLVHTGLDLRAVYQELGVAACLGGHTYDPACQPVLGNFDDQLRSLTTLSAWLNVLPLFFGLMLAAPLALEMENGTFRLAWTQSIPRMAWLWTKLLLMVAAAVVPSLIIGAVLMWWRVPADAVHSRFQPDSFDVTAAVFTAYTVFALAVGVAAAVLVRRTVPAIAISIVGFVPLRFAIEYWARPHYLPPVRRLWFSGHAPYGLLDWVVNNGFWQDPLGHTLSYDRVTQICAAPAQGSPKDSYIACLHQHGLSEVVLYQPAGRFWVFQGIETAIFLGLSAVLFGVAVWWVRYRVT